MTALYWLCRQLVKHAARAGIKHHRPHRIGRIGRRAAGIATTKPAIVGWLCTAIGAGMWGLGWPYTEMGPTSGALAGGAAPVAYLPPEIDTDILAGLPPGTELLVPESIPVEIVAATGSTQPIPEPSSLALLGTAIAVLVLAVWRMRA